MKKLILISGSPCVGKTAVGTRLFESFQNSAYLDGDWCWCVHPFSVTDTRLRNGDKSMSFVLSNYLDSDFGYVFFTSVVLTNPQIRKNILNGITAKDYDVIGFTLKGEMNYYWLHLPPCSGDIVIDTDDKRVQDVVREMKHYIDELC